MQALVVAALMALSSAASALGGGNPGSAQSGSTQSGAAQSGAAQSGAAQSKSGAETPAFDVNQLFAGSCGWCHSKGGREAGKGPQLMGTTLTDQELVSRIKTGKVGQMPGFASAFNDEQMRAIVLYIRELKPAGP
jgi:mono/diheme cytochrome c family protein